MTPVAKEVCLCSIIATQLVPCQHQQHTAVKQLTTYSKSIVNKEAIAAAVAIGKQQ